MNPENLYNHIIKRLNYSNEDEKSIMVKSVLKDAIDEVAERTENVDMLGINDVYNLLDGLVRYPDEEAFGIPLNTEKSAKWFFDNSEAAFNLLAIRNYFNGPSRVYQLFQAMSNRPSKLKLIQAASLARDAYLIVVENLVSELFPLLTPDDLAYKILMARAETGNE